MRPSNHRLRCKNPRVGLSCDVTTVFLLRETMMAPDVAFYVFVSIEKFEEPIAIDSRTSLRPMTVDLPGLSKNREVFHDVRIIDIRRLCFMWWRSRCGSDVGIRFLFQEKNYWKIFNAISLRYGGMSLA